MDKNVNSWSPSFRGLTCLQGNEDVYVYHFNWDQWIKNYIETVRKQYYGPSYQESVCHCCKVRATWTKLPDFIPIDIFQVPGSQSWSLFFKILKELDIKNFGRLIFSIFWKTNFKTGFLGPGKYQGEQSQEVWFT